MVGSSTSSTLSGVAPPVNSLASSRASLNNKTFRDAFDGGVWDEDVAIAANLLTGNAPKIPPRKMSFTQASTAQPQSSDDNASATTHLLEPGNRRRYNATSNTWTSSSGDISETDEVEERGSFIAEYNKIANQYGINVLIPDVYVSANYDKVIITGKQGSWLMRRILKRTSSMLAIKPSQKDLKHKRSISDFSMRLQAAKRDSLKDKHLIDLVRLCGSSPFYLPTEYAAGTLSLPTCFRATAQYLVQRGPATRGIFRINGSHVTVSALYDHYASQDEDGDAISGTVRCPTLPENIQCDEHDVASAFKRFLSGLPGGILGKIWLFEALVSIHNQLGVDPEWTKTKQTKVRARLIACAISSHQSRFQRDLICAVFGLLCLIGRAAETAVREDEAGRPLPTHGLMGYSALGTVFGPLLLGDLMADFDPYREEKQTDILLGKTPPKKDKKAKHKKNKSAEESLTDSRVASEKIRIANRIAEMVITHWRDVVRQMKNMGAMTSGVVQHRQLQERQRPSNFMQPTLRPSASESFFLRRPPEWEPEAQQLRSNNGVMSPTPSDRNIMKRTRPQSMQPLLSSRESQPLRRQRSRPRSASNQMLSSRKSMTILTPPREDQNETRYDKLDGRMRFPMEPFVVVGHDKVSASGPSEASSSDVVNVRITHMSPSHRTSDESGTTEELTYLVSSYQVEESSPLKDEISRTTTATMDAETLVGTDRATSSALEPFHGQKQASVNKDSIVSAAEISSKSKLDPNTEPLKPRATQLPVILPATVQRFEGQSPSDHLERILSLHATPIDRDEKSRRLNRYGATDPGHFDFRGGGYSSSDRSDGFAHHRSYEAPPTAYKSRYHKDPLQRISKAEDMASLASLGRAMMSSGDGSEDFSPAKDTSDSSSHVFKRPRKTVPSTAAQISYHVKSMPRNMPDKPLGGALRSVDASQQLVSTPTRRPRSPFTPTAETQKAAAVLKGRLNSVKSLAAKFDNPQSNASPLPSPTSDSRLTARQSPPPLAAVTAVLSSYTTNPNPSPSPSRASMKSRNSIRSTRSTTYSRPRLPASGHASPRKSPAPATFEEARSKSRLADRLLRAATCSPRSPTMRLSDMGSAEYKGASSDNAAVASNLEAVTSSLATSGDAGGSFSIVRHLPQAKKLPRPEEPPVAQHLAMQRPLSADVVPPQSDSPLQVSNLRMSDGSSMISPGLQLHCLTLDPAPMTRGRGTSMLYAQVTNLQKALDAKAEEIVNLKRQLATKNTMNELGTLNEQLREANRETAMWKKRALMAERRLERLSQVKPAVAQGKSEAAGEVSSLLDAASERLETSFAGSEDNIEGMSTMTDQRERAQAKRYAIHSSGMDGVISSEGSYESAGTVMITRRNRSSVNLMDIGGGSEDLLCLLQPLQPAMPEDKEGEGVTHGHVELYELA